MANQQLRVLFAGKNEMHVDPVRRVVAGYGYDLIFSCLYLDADAQEDIAEQFQKHPWDLLIVCGEEPGRMIDDLIPLLPGLENGIPWVVVCRNPVKNEITRFLDVGCRDVVDASELPRLEFVVYRLLKEIGTANKNKYAQETISARKRKMALALSSIGDGVLIINTGLRIVIMNDGAETITGWPAKFAVDKPVNEVFNIIDCNTGRSLNYLLSQSMDQGETVGLMKDTVLITKNGDQRYLSACISPIKVLEDIAGVVIVFRDITKIIETEKKLINEQQNMTRVFENAPVGMLLVDADAVIKKVNRSMLRMTGKHRQDVINQRLGEGLGCINSANDAGGCGLGAACQKCELRNMLVQVSKAGVTMPGIETYYTMTTGGIEKKLWLKINSVPVIYDDQEYVMLTIDDITEIKTVEEGFKRYLLLWERANDMIIFSNVDGRIIEANNSALAVYGYTREEIFNKSIFELVNPDHRSPVRTQLHKTNAGGVYYEATARRKSGDIFFVEVSLQSAKIGNKRVLISIQRDITERKLFLKELEKAREHAEAANQAKSEFLANMSHEIRTPLNGMLGMIDLTLLTALNEEQKENLFIAKGCAATLLNLINDILDFSKIEANKLALENISFNFIDLVEQTIRPHQIKAREKGLEFHRQIDSRIPVILNGDPNRLQQVLNNLLGNAVKFTSTGKIGVLIKLAGQGDAGAQAALEFQISDTGVGINPGDMGRVFGTFNQADSSITRKYGGSGLGLAISKQLVEMMGGVIWVESEIGKGSTFCFTVELPAGEMLPGLECRTGVSVIAKTKQPLRVLLAEDDRVSQVVITRIINEAGHFVKTANNGVEALRALNEKNTGDSIDIILMDIQMPEMDGIEAVKKIREHEEKTGGHIPVIALTAYALHGDREKFLAAGMDEYITKPVQVNDLLETIEMVWEKSSGTSLSQASHFIGDKDLTPNPGRNVKNILNSINVEPLKRALKTGNLSLIEKQAREIKDLSSMAGAGIIKKAIFKVQLAGRRGDLTAAAGHFEDFLAELSKYKKQYLTSVDCAGSNCGEGSCKM